MYFVAAVVKFLQHVTGVRAFEQKDETKVEPAGKADVFGQTTQWTSRLLIESW